MKTDTVFKRAFNDALKLVASLELGQALPSESALSARLGVSRTTVRKVLAALERRAYRKRRGAAPRAELGRGGTAVSQGRDGADSRASAGPLHGVDAAGQHCAQARSINELDLARKFGVATTSIREFLNRFQRFGLIEKRPNAGWIINGFTPDFALELFEIREMFELRSARALARLPESSPLWDQLAALREEHVALLAVVEERFHDFSDLDSRFHRLVNAAAPNRFIDGFYDIITLIFHYHYQWNKRDERQRNEVAIREHLTYIDALQSRDPSRIESACRAHLEFCPSYPDPVHRRGRTA